MTTKELIKAVGNMSVGELADLTKQLQEAFGVTPMSNYYQMPAVQQTVDTPQVEEPTEFDVYIVSAGDRKIQVIKRVRELTSLGLKEAKDLVDHLPAPMKIGINREEAEKLQAALEAEGATVEIRPT